MHNTMQDAKCHALTGGLDPYFVILRLHRCSFRAFPWYRLGILSQIISNFYASIDPVQSDETLVMLTKLIFVAYDIHKISEPTCPFEASLQDLHRTTRRGSCGGRRHLGGTAAEGEVCLWPAVTEARLKSASKNSHHWSFEWVCTVGASHIS